MQLDRATYVVPSIAYRSIAKQNGPGANLPVQSILAFERALLGNVLACADVGRQPSPGFEAVTPEDYYLSDHRQIAEAIFQLAHAGLPATGQILFDYFLQHMDESKGKELIAYASQLADWSPFVSPNWLYAPWIRRSAALRRVESLRAQLARARDQEEAAALSEELERALNSIPPAPPRRQE